MKRTIGLAVLTAAFSCSAATGFAAASPFSDVPADHWAYDAVAELADEGVIEGYGDGTYRGEKTITRYEMAQMVAKAMTKEDAVNAVQKALIDKLAAEFSDEIKNLGVRTSNLERNADRVKWNGELRMTGSKTFVKNDTDREQKRSELRLKSAVTLNDHWLVRARIDGRGDLKEDKFGTMKLKHVNAEGNYGNWKFELGRLPVCTEQGVIMDDFLTGGQLTYNSTKFTGILTGGRISDETIANGYLKKTGNALAAELTFKPSKNFRLTGEYFRVSGGGLETYMGGSHKVYGAKSTGVLGIGAGYTFGKNVQLNAYYGQNVRGDQDDRFGRNMNFELAYKGASKGKPGSFGIYAAYRHLGKTSIVSPTFNGAEAGWKGWEIGGQYTLAKNVVGSVLYFKGKTIADDAQNLHKIFSRVQFFF